jgi:hypothetical protein
MAPTIMWSSSHNAVLAKPGIVNPSTVVCGVLLDVESGLYFFPDDGGFFTGACRLSSGSGTPRSPLTMLYISSSPGSPRLLAGSPAIVQDILYKAQRFRVGRGAGVCMGVLITRFVFFAVSDAPVFLLVFAATGNFIIGRRLLCTGRHTH